MKSRKETVVELNVVRKNFSKSLLRVALCYPSRYRVGMCSLALHILYNLFNSYQDVVAERFFFEDKEIFPLSIESQRPLSDFDVIAFSFQYETDYANAIRMLMLSGISPLANKREKDINSPMIVAGGICAIENPKPLEPFIDVFFIGEAEPLVPKFVDTLLEMISQNRRLTKLKERVKEELAGIEGLYVPGKSQEKVRRVYAKDLNREPYPTKQIITIKASKELTPIYGPSFLMEVSRGCPYWCRFCLLGYTFKPCRYRSLKKIINFIDKVTESSEIDKIVLISSAIGDYPGLKCLLEEIVENRSLKVSMPSMRIDTLNHEIAKLLSKGGQKTLTVAPEVGSWRLMEIINKNLDLDSVQENCKIAIEGGIKQLKFYFLIGVPGEKEKDIKEIGELLDSIATFTSRIKISVNPLIPKPHTPFQWFPLEDISSLREKVRILRKSLPKRFKQNLRVLDLRWARIQVALSKGDVSLYKAVIYAAEKGGSLSIWNRALRELGILERIHKVIEEPFPWDFIDIGIPKSLLRHEYERTLSLL